MNETFEEPAKGKLASILTGGGLLAIVAVVLVAWLVIKFVFPPTPSFAEGGPVASFDWVVTDARSGEPVDMRAYEGEVLVLNFWATWCPPCRIEKPAINRLHLAMEEEGLQVLAVSLHESPETVVGYLDSHGYELPTAILTGALPAALDSSAVPTTFVINRQGEIVLKQVGAYTGWDGEGMKARLRELLDS